MRIFSNNSICWLVFLSVISLSGFAQTPFIYWDSIPVTQWGVTIKYPFAGGFNNPQFSTIDLNGDNIEDLFVFERSTNKVYTFINTGTPGQPSYTYAPQYRRCFPSELTGWVLLRDYNCDGKKDIFTSRNNSFAVYRNNFTTGTGLQFSFVEAFDQNLFYIISADIPAIDDIDNDGDLDILSFDPSGIYIYYFKNYSIESFGNCDSLNYVLEEHCWGSCSEDFFSCNIMLGDPATPCRLHNMVVGAGETNQTHQRRSEHPGNTILALDLNSDNKKEIIIGPQVCSNAIMLTNSSTPGSVDSMIAQNVLYPDTIHPIEFNLFASTFYEDVNNDGRRDLIAAPNRNASEDTASSWLYLNTGSTSVPEFSFQKMDFIQSEMIDVGEGSNPVFFDYNNDSLEDLVIGNSYYYSPGSPGPSSLALYENTGTRNSPAFKLVTRNYSNLRLLNLNGIYPAFGDMDADGDMDMIVGESAGHLYYFTNTANAGTPANFVLTSPVFDSIDVGLYSAPQIVDVNCDGKPDLLVGERSGTIKYFENIGTDTEAVFNSTPTINEFGGIDVQAACCTGYAVPFLTTDINGKFQLVVGTESDSIYSYSDIDNNLSGNFTLSDAFYSGINEGQRATVSGADLNNDGLMDLVIGNYAGGVTLFRGSENRKRSNCSYPVATLPFNIKIYPNPASSDGNLSITITGLQQGDYANIDFFNVVGQRIYHLQSTASLNELNVSIPTAIFASGIYFMKIDIPSRNDVIADSYRFVITN